LSVLLLEVPACPRRDGRARIVGRKLNVERSLFPRVRHIALAFVAVALSVSQPTLAFSQQAPADQPNNVNAPWDDLFSALGRKDPSDGVPTNAPVFVPGRAEPDQVEVIPKHDARSPLGGQHSPEPEITIAPIVAPQRGETDPVQFTPNAAPGYPKPLRHIAPLGDRPGSKIGRSARQAKAAHRRAERMERRAQGRARTGETTAIRGPRELTAARDERQTRRRPTSGGPKQRTAAPTEHAAADTGLSLPEGLTPRHAMPRR
jgi:hypothetical protein